MEHQMHPLSKQKGDYMRKLLPCLILTAFLAVPTVWAQDDSSLSTTADSNQITNGQLKDETVAIRPQVGDMTYTPTGQGSSQSRAEIGLSFDMNAISLVDKTLGNYYLGPSTGVYFSHLGDVNATFFGSNPDQTTFDSGNVLIIPLDLKAGYAITDNFRLGVHGGGNVIYNSVPGNVSLTDTGYNGNQWKMFPNAGADVEFGIGRNVSLSLRPDWTIAPLNSMFSGTLGLGVSLG